MIENEDAFTRLPENLQAAFLEFVQQLAGLAGDNLLSVAAFGGSLVGDPLYRNARARSVVVLRQLDLRLLAKLAEHGPRHGRRGLHPPVIMTPEHIAGSRDVFPLELLEIQALNLLLLGTDQFANLQFAPQDVRLQCEREVRSQLIHLHQGLLAAGGQQRHLAELCRNEAERAIRVLRGILHLAGRPAPQLATELATQAAQCAALSMGALHALLSGRPVTNFDEFEAFYRDLADLAAWLDQWHGRPPE